MKNRNLNENIEIIWRPFIVHIQICSFVLKNDTRIVLNSAAQVLSGNWVMLLCNQDTSTLRNFQSSGSAMCSKYAFFLLLGASNDALKSW